MEKVPITNHSATTMYVGGMMIIPGETKHVDPALVPPDLRPRPRPPVAAPPADPLADLAAKTVKDIRSALAGLGDEDLAALEVMEAAKGDAARKSVIEAIAAERLKRADPAV